MVSHVYKICDAYESGVGAGMENHATAQAVLASAWYGDLREAFTLGFAQGQRAPARPGSIREHEEQLIRSVVMDQRSPLSPLLDGEAMHG